MLEFFDDTCKDYSFELYVDCYISPTSIFSKVKSFKQAGCIPPKLLILESLLHMDSFVFKLIILSRGLNPFCFIFPKVFILTPETHFSLAYFLLKPAC